MDIQALEAALNDTAEVEVLGQTFTLKAPSLAVAGEIQRSFGLALNDAKDDDAKAQAHIDAFVECVKACLVEDVPQDLLEKVIVRTGLIVSPLIVEARNLCGMADPPDTEDPDLDLPT